VRNNVKTTYKKTSVFCVFCNMHKSVTKIPGYGDDIFIVAYDYVRVKPGHWRMAGMTACVTFGSRLREGVVK